MPPTGRLTFPTAASIALAVAAAGAFVGVVADVHLITRASLCVVQAACILLLATGTADRARPTWTSASFILAMAWAALFLIPSVVYTADPSLLDVDGLTAVVAAITASTACLTAGYLLSASRRPFTAEEDDLRVSLLPSRVRPLAAVAIYALGFLALAAVVMKAGGPVEYLTNLDKTLGLTAGLFYVMAIALAMRWVPMAIIAQRWGAGEPAGRLTWAALAFGLALLTLTGSRLFLVLGLVELGLLAALLKFTIPTQRVVFTGLVVGVVIIFGLGATKRYQSAVEAGTIGNLTFAQYMTERAPREVVPAYVNNYVDSLRVTALAMNAVPDRAPYETVRPLLEIALKPLPSAIRPELSRNEVIETAMSPGGDATGAYAVPIITSAWLAGGMAIMMLVSVGLGMIARALDRTLLSRAPLAPWKLILLVMAVVQLPSAIRAGVPNGIALGLTDVIGSAVVAWAVLAATSTGGRPAAATPAPETAQATA